MLITVKLKDEPDGFRNLIRHNSPVLFLIPLETMFFFFLHLKETDKAGEDGSFDIKQELIEQFDDEVLPQLEVLKPDVLCITGDHSTPAAKAGHSWHEVPMLLASPYVRPSEPHEGFGERACARGTYSRLESVKLMNLLLAHSLKLKKFGA